MVQGVVLALIYLRDDPSVHCIVCSLCTCGAQGRLDVSKLYQSDLHAVCSNGCTLLMVAAMYGQDNIVRQLLKKDVPIDFKQIKVR